MKLPRHEFHLVSNQIPHLWNIQNQTIWVRFVAWSMIVRTVNPLQSFLSWSSMTFLSLSFPELFTRSPRLLTEEEIPSIAVLAWLRSVALYVLSSLLNASWFSIVYFYRFWNLSQIKTLFRILCLTSFRVKLSHLLRLLSRSFSIISHVYCKGKFTL